MFPFLIGRIKSKMGEMKIFDVPVFPFLIGRIKRKKLSRIIRRNWVFPFLIGRIKSICLPLTKRQLHCFHSS